MARYPATYGYHGPWMRTEMRLPAAIRRQLLEAAREGRRSLNAQILLVLEKALSDRTGQTAS